MRSNVLRRYVGEGEHTSKAYSFVFINFKPNCIPERVVRLSVKHVAVGPRQ